MDEIHQICDSIKKSCKHSESLYFEYLEPCIKNHLNASKLEELIE